MLTLSLVLAPVLFRRVVKVDDVVRYDMRATIALTGGNDDVRFSGTSEQKVKSLDGDTLTLAVKDQVRLESGSLVREGRAVESVQTERLDGTLLTVAKTDPTVLFADPRVDRLRQFYPPSKPVEIGATWWRTSPADQKPPSSSYFVFEGEEKVGNRDTWRIRLDANEVGDPHPTHVKGMLWIDKADGWLDRGQWTIDGFAYSETAPPLSARLELSRKE